MEQKVNIFRLISTIIIFIVLFPGAKDAFLDITSNAKSLDEFTPEELPQDYDWIYEIDYSPNGRYFAIFSSYNGPVKLWDKLDKNEVYDENTFQSGNVYLLKDEPYHLSDLKFSPDSKYLLVYSNNYNHSKQEYDKSHMTLYDVGNKTTIRTHELESNSMEDVAFSPDGRYYASSYRKGDDSGKCTVNVWSVNSGEARISIATDNHEVKSLTFTQDGKYLVVSYDSSEYSSDSIVFYDIGTGGVSRVLNGVSAFRLQFSDDGTILAGENGNDKGLLVWDTSTYKRIAKFTDISLPSDVSLSPDGKYLMAIDNYALIIWDISSKKQILRTKVKNLDYADRFYTAKFSGDGQQILIGLEVSEDSVYLMNSRADSGRIFAYNFTEIAESYDEG